MQTYSLDRLEALDAESLLAWAIQTYGRRFAIVTSFQDEGMAIVDMATRIGSDVRVMTIDTGRLPVETLKMIDQVGTRYGLQVEVLRPDPDETVEMIRRHGWDLFRDSIARRRLCCEIRKVRPLERGLQGLCAWASGLRRAQSAERASVPRVSFVDSRLKLNPLAGWTGEQLADYLSRYNVPRHPLYREGYSSIGCQPCSRPAEAGRTGRWWWEHGAVKECGLHFMPNGRARRELDILLEEILHAQRIHAVDNGVVGSGQEHRFSDSLPTPARSGGQS